MAHGFELHSAAGKRLRKTYDLFEFCPHAAKPASSLHISTRLTQLGFFRLQQQLQKVVKTLPSSPSLDKLAKSRSSGDLKRLLSPESALDSADPIRKSLSSGKITENAIIPEVRVGRGTRLQPVGSDSEI